MLRDCPGGQRHPLRRRPERLGPGLRTGLARRTRHCRGCRGRGSCAGGLTAPRGQRKGQGVSVRTGWMHPLVGHSVLTILCTQAHPGLLLKLIAGDLCTAEVKQCIPVLLAVVAKRRCQLALEVQCMHAGRRRRRWWCCCMVLAVVMVRMLTAVSAVGGGRRCCGCRCGTTAGYRRRRRCCCRWWPEIGR